MTGVQTCALPISIVLTNTLSVGTAVDAVARYTIAQPGNEQVRSVNPLVGETNDGGLNDIRGFHVTREYSVDPLAVLRVGEVMDQKPPTVPAHMKVSELSDLIANGDPELSHRQGTLIVDEKGQIAGIITRGDLVRAIEKAPPGTTVFEAGTQDLIIAFPDEILHEAVTKMVRHDIGRLPVVRRDNPRQLVGYLGRASVMTARLRRHEEEHNREPGWLHALTQ